MPEKLDRIICTHLYKAASSNEAFAYPASVSFNTDFRTGFVDNKIAAIFLTMTTRTE